MRSATIERLISQLGASANPVVAFRARYLLLDEPPASPAMVRLRGSIRTCEMARRLLGHRQEDGTIRTHPYKKWQGPHWTLYSLALIAYPDSDNDGLVPLQDQIWAWLFAPTHLRFPSTLVLPGQEDRVRRCASQEGNALWYAMKLGLADEPIHQLARRLVVWQWPDGGWNCDKRPQARTSSVQETLIPLRALRHYGRAYGHAPALACAERAAEYLLRRRLLYRVHDGALIRPDWGKEITAIQYPIQFYDVLFALTVMAECGMLGDPRCGAALDLLAAKQLPDGGFPLEIRTCAHSPMITSRGSFADWGPGGRTQQNPFVSVDALYVLKAAGRL